MQPLAPGSAVDAALGWGAGEGQTDRRQPQGARAPPAGLVLAPGPWPLAMELSALLTTHRIHPHPPSHRG